MEFIENNLKAVIDYEFDREKYKKGEFVIDIDNVSFGEEKMRICEIEILVTDKNEADEAKEKIKDLADESNIEIEKISKKKMFLKEMNPEIYKEVYKDIKENSENKKELPKFEIKMK